MEISSASNLKILTSLQLCHYRGQITMDVFAHDKGRIDGNSLTPVYRSSSDDACRYPWLGTSFRAYPTDATVLQNTLRKSCPELLRRLFLVTASTRVSTSLVLALFVDCRLCGIHFWIHLRLWKNTSWALRRLHAQLQPPTVCRACFMHMILVGLIGYLSL